MKKKKALTEPAKRGLLSMVIAVTLIGGIPVGQTASLSLGTNVAYAQVKLNDISGHWSKAIVEKMVEQGAISGYPDGSFQPNRQITAGEFSTILANLLKVEKGTATEHWASASVSGLQAKGVTVPSDLDKALRRNDVAQMIIEADNQIRGAKNSDHFVTIPDLNSIPSNYQDYVKQAYARGYIKGDSQGRFNGSSALTRAEASVILHTLQHPNPVTPAPVLGTQSPVDESLQFLSDSRLGFNYNLSESELNAQGLMSARQAKMVMHYIFTDEDNLKIPINKELTKEQIKRLVRQDGFKYLEEVQAWRDALKKENIDTDTEKRIMLNMGQGKYILNENLSASPVAGAYSQAMEIRNQNGVKQFRVVEIQFPTGKVSEPDYDYSSTWHNFPAEWN